MKKYIVIGLLLMVGKGMATTGIPLDTEICKPGMGVEVEKGNASVGIKERGSYCNVEVGGDSVDIFGLKSDYCIEGPLDDGCEESPGVEKPSGTGKSDTSKTGKMPDGLKWYEVPGALGGGRYSRRSDSCVYRSNFFSSTPSSSVFSSLSACSPGGSSSGGKAKFPKKEPKDYEKAMSRTDPEYPSYSKRAIAVAFGEEPDATAWPSKKTKYNTYSRECTFERKVTILGSSMTLIVSVIKLYSGDTAVQFLVKDGNRLHVAYSGQWPSSSLASLASLVPRTGVVDTSAMNEALSLARSAEEAC